MQCTEFASLPALMASLDSMTAATAETGDDGKKSNNGGEMYAKPRPKSQRCQVLTVPKEENKHLTDKMQ